MDHKHCHKTAWLVLQGREKIGLVLIFTNMGFDVVVSDVDTVWLQNPLPYLANYPEADILVSSDSLVSPNSLMLNSLHNCTTQLPPSMLHICLEGCQSRDLIWRHAWLSSGSHPAWSVSEADTPTRITASTAQRLRCYTWHELSSHPSFALHVTK